MDSIDRRDFMRSVAAGAALAAAGLPATAAPAGTPVVTATTLSFTSFATGSLTQSNPAQNALWNPVTFQGQDVVDLTTAIDNAKFTLTFADGDTLTGNLVGNVSAILSSSAGARTATEVWTFTGGAGQFSGASGGMNVTAVAYANNAFTASGSGTLTAAGIVTPEPASLLLFGAGLLGVAWMVKRRNRRSAALRV